MKILIITPLLATLLGACAYESGHRDFDPKDYQAHFGQSVRQNVAVQTVNPDAPSSDVLEASGARAALAQQRYRTDKVEKPESATTLKSTTESGNSGAGNSGGSSTK
jgi:hypothetical protein